ncbi:MAG TPA: DUF4386 family protein [Phytomonospora sp.]
MPRKLNTSVPARSHGLAGVGFAALIVLGNVVLLSAGMPTPGSDDAGFLAFLDDHRTAVAIATALTPLTWALAAIFGAGAVRALPAGQRAWALAGFAGIILQNGVFTGIVALRAALASADNGAAEKALLALHDAFFGLNGTFLALAMTGLSIAGVRGGLIPHWHAAVGFTGAALQFASATLTPWTIDDPGPLGLLGLAGWLLWVVWIAAYGLILARSTPGRRTVPA